MNAATTIKSSVEFDQSPDLMKLVHAHLQQALTGRETADMEALAALGFTDVFVARNVLQLFTIAIHQDADDVPNVDLRHSDRIVTGLLAKRIITPRKVAA